MMRHRPDLCVGGTAAGGTTALSDALEYPPPNAHRQSNKRPGKPTVGLTSALRCAVQSHAPEDVVLGHLDLVEAEGP